MPQCYHWSLEDIAVPFEYIAVSVQDHSDQNDKIYGVPDINIFCSETGKFTGFTFLLNEEKCKNLLAKLCNNIVIYGELGMISSLRRSDTGVSFPQPLRSVRSLPASAGVYRSSY